MVVQVSSWPCCRLRASAQIIAGLTHARWIELVEVVTAVMEHPGGPPGVGLAFPPSDLFPRAEPWRELAAFSRKVKRLPAQQDSIGTQQEFSGYESAAEIVGHVVPVRPVGSQR